ncbi:MAG: hypothetical protein DWQ01_21475 [Planctomycetota bacterium]|nr:MAG: hypothetical protein DWQ01_21475 [Planctomycetota bacterium]
MSQSHAPVVITATSALTPFGCGGEDFWLGITQATHSPSEKEVPALDVKALLGPRGLRHWDRTALLLGCAARLAMNEGDWEQAGYQPDEAGVVFGSTHGSIEAIVSFDKEAVAEGPRYVNPQAFANTVINAPAGRLAMHFDLPGLNTTVSSGLSSVLDAIGYAEGMIRRGRIQAVLCGGALGWSPAIAWGYERNQRLAVNGQPSPPFDAAGEGGSLREGAGVLLLECPERAAARNRQPLAKITGSGACFEPDVSSPSFSGPESAIRFALKQAGREADELAAVVSCARGLALTDEVEFKALANLVPETVPITAPAGACGDSLETVGALAMITAVEMLTHGQIPKIAGGRPRPGLNLVLEQTQSFAPGPVLVSSWDPEGHGAAVILEPG